MSPGYGAAMQKLTILVAGAGIGGLCFAAAASRRGHRVRVLERAPELGPVGAGITVQPNAMAALARIDAGLPVAVRAAGMVSRRARILEPDGRILSSLALDEL